MSLSIADYMSNFAMGIAQFFAQNVSTMEPLIKYLDYSYNISIYSEEIAPFILPTKLYNHEGSTKVCLIIFLPTV